MASNDLLALLDLAAGVLERAGLRRREALDALLPLARGTLEQAAHDGLEGALTGPVVRGDAATVAAHLRRLRRGSRAAERAHRELSRRLLEIAARAGRLSPARRTALRRLLG